MSKARDFVVALREGELGGGGGGGPTNVRVNIAATSTAVIDPAAGDTFVITLSVTNCTISFAAYTQEAGKVKDIRVLIKQGAGANKWTFGTAVMWVNDLEPVESTGAGDVDSMRLSFVNGFAKPMGFFEGGNLDV